VAPLISVPSWVIPGGYADNLRFLVDKREVHAVELLFFLYEEDTKELLSRELGQIRSFTDRFTFTVHLPDRVQSAHRELVERLASVARHFIVHPAPIEDGGAGADSLAALLEDWREDFGDRFLLENTYPGRLEEALKRRSRAPLCMDTGHLLLSESRPADFLAIHGDEIRQIHLHGLGEKNPDAEAARAVAKRDGRLPDHRCFTIEEPWFQDIAGQIGNFDGVVELELFSWPEVETMIKRLKNGILSTKAQQGEE